MAGLGLAQQVRTDRLRGFDTPRPAGFAERGVAVAFTTPALASAHLRSDGRGRLEVVLPNLIDGRGVYVVPWPALGEIMAPTVHDRVLHQEIVVAPSLDPERLRLLQLRVMARGLAGADAAAVAETALAADGRVATAVNFALMVQLIHAGGVTSAEALEAAENGRAGAEYKRALGSVAARLGVGALELSDRIASLSGAAAAFGLPEPGPAGRLRRLIARVEQTATAIADWAEAEAGDHGEIARVCGQAGALAATRADAILAGVDHRLDDLIPTLRAWPADKPRLDQARLRLAWLLDGWRRVIVAWETARGMPRPVQRAALGQIFPALPLLPEKADPSGEALDVSGRHRRLMRHCCRLFDEMDNPAAVAELIRRMERAKLDAELL
ncbi:MAG: hypothetical protein JO305_04005 [Alphaproteobacteria bacterium]|nr:hypothetical protein [Alphaproteobacteria bacterium]